MSNYQYNLCAVAIMKYEEPYVAEWVAYHRVIGIDHFFIYDNDENSRLKEVLRPYIDSDVVTLRPMYGDCKQFDAYNDGLHTACYQTKYLAFFDADEFLFPIEDRNAFEVVDEIFEKYKKEKPGGLGINWAIFDDNGHITKPEGLVIENYLSRANAAENIHIKSIVDPRAVVKFVNPHFANYERGFSCIDENGKRIDGPFCYNTDKSIIRFNHYFFKSEEEYKSRLKKKKATVLITEEELSKVLENIKSRLDKSKSIYDDSMLRYVDRVKDELTRMGYNLQTGKPI